MDRDRHAQSRSSIMAANPAAKTRPETEPYEIWEAPGGWRWLVLKKYQADDHKPYARWFCKVYSPMLPGGELGDVYASEVMSNARRVFP
jgi:hypothetical protein